MKRILIVLFVFFLATGVIFAQNGKGVESNIQFSQGMFVETGGSRLGQVKDLFKYVRNNPKSIPSYLLYYLSSSSRISYGLDIQLGGPWSLMPGAGLRGDVQSLWLIGSIGGDVDLLGSLDAFCSLRYHLDAGGVGIIFGLGPDVSYIFYQSPYYIDADPGDPLNGKDKFYHFDYAVQPSITFRAGKHWQWGLEANLGVRNIRIPYPQYTDSPTRIPTYLDRISFTCGFHF